LIPLVLKAVAGLRPSLEIYGTDYPTNDGTCVRDYIHVNDLAVAHILALKALAEGGSSRVYNLGNGSGYSVLEVIKTAEAVTGLAVPVTYTGRRPGDPAVLVAGSERIKEELGWQPQYPGLRELVESAWHWHSNHPEGY
jgi:UDP-glucose 4-epimerase